MYYLVPLFNNFWYCGYPDLFRVPMWVVLLLILSLLNLKYLKFFKGSVILLVPSFASPISAAFSVAYFIITNVYYSFIENLKLPNLLLLFRVLAWANTTLCFVYYLLGDFRSISLFTIEPSNFAYTGLLPVLFIIVYGKPKLKIEGIIQILLMLFLFPSKTMVIGLFAFLFVYFVPNIFLFVYRMFFFIVSFVPLLILSNTERITSIKKEFITDGSIYALLNGWTTALHVFLESPLGRGYILPTEKYYEPESAEIVEFLNNRDLATFNAYILAVYGFSYFLIALYFGLKRPKRCSFEPIFIAFLYMYMARWSGIFNSFFLFVVLFYISLQRKGERHFA